MLVGSTALQALLADKIHDSQDFIDYHQQNLVYWACVMVVIKLGVYGSHATNAQSVPHIDCHTLWRRSASDRRNYWVFSLFCLDEYLCTGFCTANLKSSR